MKRIQKFAAACIIAALIGTGAPAIAAENRHDVHDRAATQYRSADSNRDRDFRNDNRWARDRRDYDRHERDADYRDARTYSYSYAPAPVYQPAPVYGQPVYKGGYYYEPMRNGRTAAIIGGSAAAGALIGAAAGHGQGAVIGAVVGGIAGAAVSAAANHHDRY
jgi:hypothetical protein